MQVGRNRQNLDSFTKHCAAGVSFAQNCTGIETGRPQSRDEPRTIKSVSVIGAGVMGRSIAAANLERHLAVTITDVSSQALSKGIAQILEDISQHPGIKGPHFPHRQHGNPPLRGSTSDAELGRCDLVIEAVVERLDTKKRLLQRLEPHLSNETVVTSNTSCIPISDIAVDMQHPERFCGLHFCHPVRHRPLVEVIRGEQTSDQTVATTVAYAKALGKSPIVVQDGPGFLVNRLLLPYLNEALELILDGASVGSVEAAAEAFGMSMGPLSHLDSIGIDVALRAGAVLLAAFPDRVVASELLVSMYRAGRMGQKSGGGFYVYEDLQVKAFAPQAERIIGKRRRGLRPFTPPELTRRLLLPMLLEATRVLEEQRVPSARHVDQGLIDGIGFPSSKGGLLMWADTWGAAQIVESLKPLQQLGQRYRPTNMLLEMAKHRRRFYE